MSAKLIALLRHYLITRENLWVVLICLMLFLLFIAATMGIQPRFVYGGF